MTAVVECLVQGLFADLLYQVCLKRTQKGQWYCTLMRKAYLVINASRLSHLYQPDSLSAASS